MNFRNLPSLARNCLIAGVCVAGFGVQSALCVSISYTSTISPNKATSGNTPGDYAGEPNLFYLPYTSTPGSAAINTAETAGQFVTDALPAATSPNPDVTASNITFTVTPTIGSTAYSPVVFTGEITNPATNVYCLDFGTVNTSTNCATSNPNTFDFVAFDNNLYEVGVETYTDINSLLKTTNLLIEFVPGPGNTVTPEPLSLGLTGLALCGLAALKFRRKQTVKA